MSRETNAGGMKMAVEGPNFDITMLSGSRDGIFKNPYHIKVHEDNALYWEMTATNNLNNYNRPEYNEENELITSGDQGIHPGTEGVISFKVTPKTENIDLVFDFEIIGYQASKNAEEELVMTPLSELENDEGLAPEALLNGHILLFEEKTETLVDGVNVTSYSKPILSDQDMHRVMSRRISGETQIDIYWVWPNTLSTIVDARTFTGITTVPFCEDTASYTAITSNLHSYPQYYLKGAVPSDNIDASVIAAHYDNYGDMYDQGDNEIGMRVHYILIKLSVTEGTAVGGGS